MGVPMTDDITRKGKSSTGRNMREDYCLRPPERDEVLPASDVLRISTKGIGNSLAIGNAAAAFSARSTHDQ